MRAELLYSVLGAAVLTLVVVAARVLRRSSRLQRRLFLLFLALSSLPALVALVISWSTTERNLGLLESPGLDQAVESSIELARILMAREKRDARALADSLAAAYDAGGGLPEPPPGLTLRVTAADGAVLLERGPLAGGTAVDLAAIDAPFDRVERVILGGKPHLVALAPLHSGASLRVVRPVDPELAAHVDRAARGATRLRQLHLFYSKLLRADTILTVAGLALLLAGISLVLSRRFARQIGGPIAELAEGTERVASGDLEHEVRVDAIDELRDLASAFNRMTRDLKESKDRLVRTERIAAWQGVARRLAHEIKNPLTPITLSIHRIRKKVEDPVVLDCLTTVLEETQNLERLAEEFSMYARMPAPEKHPIRPVDLLRNLVELYARKSQVEVVWKGWDDAGWAMADEGLIRQVFSNLIKNALEAMNGRGTLTLRAETGAGRVGIWVEDEGPGLPEDPSRLFDPDYSTKEAGTGLGLAISRKIVEDHGGRLLARPRPGGGASFLVELPGAAEGAPRAEGDTAAGEKA